MKKNFKLVIEYDGTDYHGWQRQKHERTVQAEIEQQLSLMTCRPVTLHGSGRTDAGVHALGQVAHFIVDTRLNADVFLKGLNRLLPRDIVIRSCRQMPDAFHARYDAKWKTYRYHVHQDDLPPAVGARYVWHIRKKLDIGVMRNAAGMVTGTHDFKAFEGSGSPRSSTIRTLRKAVVEISGCCLAFEFQANGFLKHMVRNLVGTLVDVGAGAVSLDDFQAILASRNRTNAGITAPPQGLFLMRVAYETPCIDT